MEIESSGLLLLAQIVFFVFIAWHLLARPENKPRWVPVVAGVSALVVALLLLLAVVD
jgi:hypothetical protein